MLRLRIIWIMIFVTGSACAQYPGYRPVKDPETFTNSFAAASRKLESLSADFTQEKKLSLLSEKIISSGKFWFKKDNRVRMEYQVPFQYLLILNRGNIFVRDGEKENRMSSKSNRLFQQINGVLVDCLNGSILGNTNFTSRIFENNAGYLLELVPLHQDLAALFKTIVLVVDRRDFLASLIDMQEPSGDETSIHFTRQALNPPIADALFSIH
jgi:outer membrane lipoprotein-sorting protein